MFDLIGNVKITNETRLSYLLATIKSFLFVKDNIGFYLNVDCKDEYKDSVRDAILNYPIHSTSFKTGRFGDIYCDLINKGKNNYIFHFEEDHFCTCDNTLSMITLLHIAKNYNVDIIKATFFELEQKIYQNIDGSDTKSGTIYRNTPDIFNRSQRFYRRFYIGVNCIFERGFALRYWGRDADTPKPHSFEIRTFDKEFEHNLMIPNFEILTSIDDNHGVPNTCLLDNPNGKWNKIYQPVKT